MGGLLENFFEENQIIFKSFDVEYRKRYTYHKAKLRKVVYYEPDLEKPESLNEKICHRLIFDRNALHTTLAGRSAVRTCISNRNGNLKVPKLIGVTSTSKRLT